MPTTDTASGAGRPGILRRLLADWLASHPSPASADPPVMTECRFQAPIAVPASGDAFDFQVRPTLTWFGKDTTAQTFEEWIDTYTPDAIHTLRLRIEPEARKYEPHRAQQLEEKLNAMLAARDWEFGPATVTLTCRPEVLVLPDRRIRETMQPFWRRRVEMQSEHDLAMRRAELIQERTQAWSTIMAALQEDPHARHAALLAEHKEFAEVFKEMTQGRKDELVRLIEMLEKARQSFNGIGLYEYAESLDAALKAYRKQAGLG
ncbi:hypothetical protein [Allorhizocola rhizosphaerae]|uniref:hypothetical protein n=1 Tax=Allorhizocola rhizosphaerae TaxID=1872709 RepID=UPI000E3D7E97|nr:hypothetical protein [Allorhizocola rhizosphaerae]